MYQGELIDRDENHSKYSDGHLKGSSRFKAFLIDKLGEMTPNDFKCHFKSNVDAALWICDREIEFDYWVEQVGLTPDDT